MSQKLYFEPVSPSRARSLGCGLKWAIQRHYGTSAGVDITMRMGDVPFLRGVQAASEMKGDQWRDCEQLIEEIYRNQDGVRVWIAE